MSNANNTSIGPFKAIGQLLSATVRVLTSIADGVEQYGIAFKKSGEMANAAIDNAKEEQLLELDMLKSKRRAAQQERASSEE